MPAPGHPLAPTWQATHTGRPGPRHAGPPEAALRGAVGPRRSVESPAVTSARAACTTAAGPATFMPTAAERPGWRGLWPSCNPASDGGAVGDSEPSPLVRPEAARRAGAALDQPRDRAEHLPLGKPRPREPSPASVLRSWATEPPPPPPGTRSR